MRSVLIDRSLVDTDYRVYGEVDDEVRKLMFSYVCALLEAGADYIELDFTSLIRLPKPSGSEKYIYRIGEAEEYVVANALNFSYAVLPLEFSYVVAKLEVPAILEVRLSDARALEVLNVVTTNPVLDAFDMLRVVGDFRPDTIRSIVNLHRSNTIVPLDICPSDTMLTALECAVTAAMCACDAVTVCFGGSNKFATLEETLILLSAAQYGGIRPNFLEGICKCALLMTLFSDKLTSNLDMMMQKYSYGYGSVKNVDIKPNKEKQDKLELSRLLGCNVRNPENEHDKRRFVERVAGKLGADVETAEEIARILNECSVQIENYRKK